MRALKHIASEHVGVRTLVSCCFGRAAGLAAFMKIFASMFTNVK